MRIGQSGLFLLAVLALLAWHYGSRALSFVESAQDHRTYYRLLAKYQHGDEIVDFDIVVGCNVRVTHYGDGGSSYDAIRDPVAFAKPLHDESALMQIVPDACRGETTENGRVPHDFLPGVIWFEQADDLSLGIAYLTEDAFENPKSVLKFLGASIQPATRADWKAFQPTAAKNLLDPRPLFTVLPPPERSEVIRRLGDRKALAALWPGMTCHAVSRLHLGDTARAIIRDYWPTPRPRFWTLEKQEMDAILQRVNLFGDADGDPTTHYLSLGHHTANGFPTQARGGVIGSRHKDWDLRPPTIFPIRRDEGLPWITRGALDAMTFYRDIEVKEHQGFAYCYQNIWLREPSDPPAEFLTRIDGARIYGEASANQLRHAGTGPGAFFENDEYLYFKEEFGLN